MKRFLSLLLGFLVVTTGVHAQDSDVGTPPERVWLENSDIVITDHQSGHWNALYVNFSPDNGEINRKMTWEFSNEGIIKIEDWPDDCFAVFGLGLGTTKFVGTTVNGLKVEGTATVEGIMFKTTECRMNVGQSLDLGIITSNPELLTSIDWRIDNPDIISVSNDGIVTANAAGQTWLSASAEVNGRITEASASIWVYPQTGSVALSSTLITLPINDTNGINVIFPENSEYQDGTWDCSDENVVRFENTEGNYCSFKGISNGTATITYTAANGATASCDVTVFTYLNDFSLNTNNKALVPGESFQIDITTDPENSGQTFSFRSDNDEVATVDDNGLVTAVGYGETLIFVNPTQQGWPEKSLRVKVGLMPESVVFENPNILIKRLNSSENLFIRFTPDTDDVCKDIEWKASEEGIVKFYDWGNGNYGIEGLSFGTVGITGTTPNGLTVEGTVTVSGIEFDTIEFNLTLGETATIGVNASSDEILNAIVWESNDNNIVSISQSGEITALSYGRTGLSAEANVNGNLYYAYASATVHPESGAVAMANSAYTFYPGATASIDLIWPISDEIYNGTWTNSDENVVRIDDSNDRLCNITCVSAGTATLTFTASNGATASCEVTVYSHINDFTLNAEQANLLPGETFQIEVTTDPENAGQTFNFRSENEEVATVDANGLVTAVGYGETEIAVNPVQQGWPTRWFRVNVAKMPESIVLENPIINITELDNISYALDIKFFPEEDNVCKDIKWTFSEEGIIEIRSWNYGSYYIIGNNFGSVNFIGTTPNGLTVEGTANVSGIKFGNVGYDLSMGQVQSLDVTTSSEEIRDAISWRVDNTDVVSVSQDGIMTALSPGYAWVVANAVVNDKWYNTSAQIAVHPEAGSVAMGEKQTSIGVNNSTTIRVIFPIDENYDGVWSSSNENIVRIEDTDWNYCNIYGVTAGTATLTYTASNGASASCEVTVYTNINDFTLNAEQANLVPGDTFQIEVTTDPENAGQTFNYRSEDENIATVDENGLVTAVGAGETYIRVEPAQQGWPTRWLRVIVQQMPESFEILNPEITFNGIDIITLVELAFTPDNDEVCKDLTWESSDPNIGYIIRIGNDYFYSAGYNFGTANLTLTTANGLSQNAVINVRGIKIAEKTDRNMNMNLGESIQFTVEASSPELVNGCTWDSLNTDVATVDQNGLVTAVGYGEARVRVYKFYDGEVFLDWVNIHVLPTSGTIGLNKESLTMEVGDWYTLNVIYPPYEEDYSGSWSCSNSDVISIESYWGNGCEIKAIKSGEATITYTLSNGVTASCLVTVNSDVEAIELNAYELNDLQPGDQFQIVAHTYPVETEAQFIYQSENSDVASVSEEGLLTINGYGETIIHVYLADNASIDATIFVKVEAMPESIVIENNEIEVTNTSSFESIPLDVILDFPDDVEADEDYINDEIVWTCEPEGIVEVVKEVYEEYDPVRNPMRKLSPRVLKERYVIKPTGRELGDVTVTGTTANGLTATANISVTGIAFPYGDMDLEIGENRFIDVKTIPEELAAMITYTVGDNYVADIENGIVVAKAAGYTTVYATAEYNGATYSSSFNVNVRLKDPTGVTALKESITLSLGQKVTYAVKDLFEVEPAEDVNDFIYIYNSNYNIVNVNVEWTDGQRYITLEALNEGESDLTAYTSNWNYSAQIPVYVVEEETAISLNEEFVILPMLTQKQLVATVTPADREGEIKWTSSNPWSVSVDENGVISARGIGSAIITASFTDQYGVTVSATCEVYVPFFSGVEEILEDGETCDIFTVDGIVLKKNASTEDLKSLTNGVYVIKKGADTFKIKI